jgi:hypothetical protein
MTSATRTIVKFSSSIGIVTTGKPYFLTDFI